MKLAIIGLGDIAQKAHLPVITQIPGLELLLCTRDKNTLKKLSRLYRIEQLYTDYRALIKAGVDAVMIHSSTDSHREMASFFLQQGIPTFVDKPLADNAFDCEILYELAAKHRQPLYLGFNRRFIPLYNQYLPVLQNPQEHSSLLSLRWEKNRFNQAGDIRTFIFDDFIHPLDSVNLDAKNNLDDVYLTWQFKGQRLARVDVQWQQQNTLLHASMNRVYGMTKERVSGSYENSAFEFDSFVSGKRWQDNQQSVITLPDWTPMLTGKGFTGMITDWLSVVENGKLDQSVVDRNLATHQLAELICQKILG
ncbi:MAG: virulence factor [Psychromonas sp.]|jgi:virulence factor